MHLKIFLCLSLLSALALGDSFLSRKSSEPRGADVEWYPGVFPVRNEASVTLLVALKMAPFGQGPLTIELPPPFIPTWPDNCKRSVKGPLQDGYEELPVTNCSTASRTVVLQYEDAQFSPEKRYVLSVDAMLPLMPNLGDFPSTSFRFQTPSMAAPATLESGTVLAIRGSEAAAAVGGDSYSPVMLPTSVRAGVIQRFSMIFTLTTPLTQPDQGLVLFTRMQPGQDLCSSVKIENCDASPCTLR
eukprot:Filipodium_phascolosomae@DN2521_c0_g1_i1.p1